MSKQIKLLKIDFAKVYNATVKVVKPMRKFIIDHESKLIAGVSLSIVIDDIRVRLGRKKDQKVFKKNASKQQQVIRKHEAEINVLKDEADQAQKTMQKVDQLASIVNNMTERDVSE